MTSKTGSLTIILLSLLTCINISAQNSTSSPYSMFGVGMLVQREDASSAGMGHAGIAVAPSECLNIANPAAINNLDSTTFYLNFQMKAYYAHQESEMEKQSVTRANIDGLAFGFRVKKWWGMALGYTPYSTVGYSIVEPRTVYGDGSEYTVKYTGSGGLSRAYWNNALSVFKNHLSFGASLGVLWGTFTNKETAIFSGSLNGENIYNTRKYTCNNLYFEYGMQFHFDIGKNNFRFGATYNSQRSMRSSYRQIVSNDISSQLFLEEKIATKDEFKVPQCFGAGIAYTRGKFMATADFKYNKWGDIENAKYKESITYKDNYVIGGGIQYSAGKREDPFFKRMRYRLGYYYSTENIIVKQQKLDEYGVTAGLTIPLGRWNNSIVIAYEHLTRGTLENGLVKETYKNIKISFNIRETWFLKSKFD